MKKYNLGDMKKINRRLMLILILLGISLGYALLSETLTINGRSKISAQSWDIHWNNVQVSGGSVAIGSGDQAEQSLQEILQK